MSGRFAGFWERTLGGLAALAVRRPRSVLAAAAAIALLAAALAATRLELRSSNLDLIDPDLPEIARFRDFAERFGTPNVLVAVLEGDDPARLPDLANELAERLPRVAGVRAVLARLPFRDETLAALGVDPYFRSEDGGLLFVFVQPDDPGSSATTIAPFVDGVRAAVAKVGPSAFGAKVGFTGLPQYALDDRDFVQRDISKLSGISFLLVAAIFAVGFRGVRVPLLAMTVLAFAALVTAGVAAVVPGHLTLVSAFFFSILFGLGIDFSIHLMGRVEELEAAGIPRERALVEATRFLGPGLGTGASTTALSFFVLMASGFRGFAELGGLAGVGVLVALFATVALLPAALALRPRGETVIGARGRGARLLLRLQRPWLAAALAALALGAFAAGVPPFDGNYLDLEPKGSEAVRLEREMVARSRFAPQFAAFVAPDAKAARSLAARLRGEPTVAGVRAATDFAPLLAVHAEIEGAFDEFRSLYVDAEGRYAVYAFPAGDVWEPGFQQRFLEAMRAIDPEVTGMPVIGQFLVERSRLALRRTAWLAAGMLLLVVFADFRRPAAALLATLPTFLGLAAALGAMRLLGVPFNPLNVLALPVVLGIAEDSGVHLVHRFLAERGDLERTLAGAGRTVGLSGATTLAGFGALAAADHQGLASFALALSLGVGAALLLSLVVLPTLLRAASGRVLGARPVALAVALAAAAVLSPRPVSGGELREPGGAEARAARCWSERARGFESTGRVDPEPVRCAIAAFAEASAAEPDRLDLRFRRIEALWFSAHFAATEKGAARRDLDLAVELADDAIERIEASASAALAAAGGDLDRMAAALASVPDAGEAHFWAAIAWGEWGLERGSLAAVARGVPARLRRHAELAARLAPDLRDGGGLRLLGRVHTTMPHLPLVSSWVDRERGVELLRSALETSDRDPRNLVFLAEALLDYRPAARAEAIDLLRRAVARPPDPIERVEQSETLSAARARLSALARQGTR